MSRRYLPVLVALSFLRISSPAIAEDTPSDLELFPFQLHIDTGASFPITGDIAPYIRASGMITLAGVFPIKTIPWLSFTGEVGYIYSRARDIADVTISEIVVGGGIEIHFSPVSRLLLRSVVTGGLDTTIVTTFGQFDAAGGSFYIRVGAGGYYKLTPWLDLGTTVGYWHQFGDYGGPWATVETIVRFPRKAEDERVLESSRVAPTPFQGQIVGEKLIKLKDLSFFQIFPILYSHYDDHPVGRAVLFNSFDKPATDITVSLFVKQYMDAPKECGTIDALEAGMVKEIDLFALFTDSVLGITEGTTVAAEVTLEYTVAAQRYRDTFVKSMMLEHRNAMTWDDDRKAAAFITVHDPQVLFFSNNITGMIKGGEYQINENMGKVIAIHEALRLFGMSYVIDPNSPYVRLSEDVLQVDTLKFPRESLMYKAGDCDDLSILYSALLESVGIETAFITIPGHIYLAFSIGLDQASARRQFQEMDNFIIREEKTWIPLEITALEDSFLDAWQEGAREWKENSSRAGFYPVHDAWQIYRPVGLPGAASNITIPDKGMIIEAYISQVKVYVDREVAALRSRIEKADGGPHWVNKLGVLYARYGLYVQAKQEFARVLENQEYAPALLNMGNIYFIKEDMEGALAYYERALEQKPDSFQTLMFLARTYHGLENYEAAQEIFNKLKGINAELAEEYAFLAERREGYLRSVEVRGKFEWDLWADDE